MNKFNDPILKFNKAKHKYTYKGLELMSVTKFTHTLFEEFDASAVAKRMQHIPGNTLGVRALQKKWKESSSDGSLVHKEAEEYVTLDKIPLSLKGRQAEKFINTLQNDYTRQCEVKVFSLTYGLAGTIDLLLTKDGHCNVIDYKTNKEIRKNGYKGKKGIHKFTKMLEDCNYNHYSLQLGFYQLILELDYGLIVDECLLVHLQEDMYEVHKLPYMKHLCEEILNS